MRRIVIPLLFGTCMFFAPRHSWGFDEALVDAFSAKVSALVCSDGGKWLSCYSLQASECLKVADSFVKPCAHDIMLPIQSTLSYEKGVQTASELLACFNERFEQSYGSKKVNSDECNEPPEHLRPN